MGLLAERATVAGVIAAAEDHVFRKSAAQGQGKKTRRVGDVPPTTDWVMLMMRAPEARRAVHDRLVQIPRIIYIEDRWWTE